MRLHVVLAFAALAALAACAETTQKYWKGGSAFVAVPTACNDNHFPVYFAEGSDKLTDPARQVIDAKAQEMKVCGVHEVRVIGLADATGTPEANLTLSQKRARRVAEALEASGFPKPIFAVRAEGAHGAVRWNGQEEPVRHRVEVYLSVGPAPVKRVS